MFKFIFKVVFLCLIIGLVWLYVKYNFNKLPTDTTSSVVLISSSPSPTPTLVPTEIPIDYSKYSFENLSKKVFKQREIIIGRLLKKGNNFNSYVFTYKSEEKTISGMINLPMGPGKFPVIVLIHGWADKEAYYPGYGTEKSANFLAENGFLTLSPDFSGYGTSDWEDEDILEARFSRPVEVLNLLSSIPSLDKADPEKIGIWGHSNGGQIALSVLEITGQNYPTSLWAPVSLDFPECVLTYLGTEEVGNIVKESIDKFLIINDPKKFSVGPYLEKITSLFIVHQADQDEYIEPLWTKNLVTKLKNNGLNVEYFTYKKENHNFNRYKTTGEVLRQRDLEFFKKQLAD
jgi:dienelactone hydrolase